MLVFISILCLCKNFKLIFGRFFRVSSISVFRIYELQTSRQKNEIEISYFTNVHTAFKVES